MIILTDLDGMIIATGETVVETPVHYILDRLLIECDWTQFSDSPLLNEEKLLWQAYRQQLRDLPLTVDINNPVYPVKP